MRRRIRIARQIGSALIVLFLVIELYPIFWLIISSFKSPTEFVTLPSYVLPKGFYFQNYIDAWTTGRMSVFFLNSVIATALALIMVVYLSFTVSFAVTKMQWKFSKIVFGIFLTGILIPVQVVLIPLFIIFRTIKLINTLGGLSMIYAAFGMSVSVFLISSYLRYIPNEIIEAAIVDGCTIFHLVIRVVLPMALNGIMTVLVIQFFVIWNDLLFSMTFISSQDLRTIQAGLLYFQNEYGSREWGPIFASISIAVVPTIALYATLNKLVIRGMVEGAVKG